MGNTLAKIIHHKNFTTRIKKYEHLKIRLRSFIFKLSILINITTIVYFLYEHGKLTTIIERVNPIMEALKPYLPHLMR